MTPRADGAPGLSDANPHEPVCVPGSMAASPPAAAPGNPPEASACAPPVPAPAKTPAEVEVDVNTRVQQLEETMMMELAERKRKAEEQMEQEMMQKKQCIQKQIEDLVEQRSVEESRLALASEQLQEKMACVSEEQTFLDELQAKSKDMQKKLEAAAEHKPEDVKEKQKHALRLKLQA